MPHGIQVRTIEFALLVFGSIAGAVTAAALAAAGVWAIAVLFLIVERIP